jgi:hypothetical protein
MTPTVTPAVRREATAFAMFALAAAESVDPGWSR